MELSEAYGWNVPEVTKERPTAQEISRLDRILPLLYQVAEPYRTIVVGRMMGASWTRVGERLKAKGMKRTGNQELREGLRRGLEALYVRDPSFFGTEGP